MAIRTITDQYMQEEITFCNESHHPINQHIPLGAEITMGAVRAVVDECWQEGGCTSKTQWAIASGMECLDRAGSWMVKIREVALAAGFSDLPSEGKITIAMLLKRAMKAPNGEDMALRFLRLAFIYENEWYEEEMNPSDDPKKRRLHPQKNIALAPVDDEDIFEVK